MSTEQFLEGLWGFLATWGPVALIAGGIFFLLVLAGAISVFVIVIKSFLRMK